MNFKKTMYILTVLFLLAAVTSSLLYINTYLAVFLTLTITFTTTSYHFIMRLIVGCIYDSKMHNHTDYTKPWYQPKKFEKVLYKKLKVKKWKNKMPTYTPEQFDPANHSYEEIAEAMCQAELVHETIVVFSFLPILAGKYVGDYPVFIITSLLAAMFDLAFVIMQRYNRPRIIKIIKLRKSKQ